MISAFMGSILHDDGVEIEQRARDGGERSELDGIQRRVERDCAHGEQGGGGFAVVGKISVGAIVGGMFALIGLILAALLAVVLGL